MNHCRSQAPLASVWLETQEAFLKATREQLREEIEREAAGLGITGTTRPRERGDLSEEEREDQEAVAARRQPLHSVACSNCTSAAE